jgi:hypothetical protein
MTAEIIARVHIVLDDTMPAIWRKVDVPVSSSLKMLHTIIQAAMGWEDCHLWHFEAGGKRYGIPDRVWPDSEMAAARNVKLASLIDRGVRELLYTYDFGDDWRHSIIIEAVGPGDVGVKYPIFVAGERRCPPEDVGGLPGFELFIEAMANPKHKEHRRLREWYGGPYNRDDIDERFTRRAIGQIANRRYASKIAFQKRKDG